MVNTQDVIDGQRVAQAQNPPRVAGAAVVVPVIQRVAPQLTIRRKVVRRAARHAARLALGIGLKQLAARPCVGGIRGNVNRNIAHNGYALGLCVGVQGAPLAVELILQKGPEFNLLGMLLPELCQCLGLPHAQGAGPLLPVHHAVADLDGHIQAVVGQPVAAQELETVPVIGVRRLIAGHRALLEEILVRLAQHGKTLVVQRAVVDLCGIAAPVDAGIVLFGQQAVRGQLVKVDEVGVARKGGKALVGAVGVAGGANRQNLPDGLARRGQKVHKVIGRLAHTANAVPAGQAGNRHQNSAATIELHDIFLLLM